jgi:lipopolysaccharide heptosyltransferase I
MSKLNRTEVEIKNILIIKPSAAGDIICALPILSALKKRYPHVKIAWLVASHLAPLIQDHPLIDQVIPFERKRFTYLARSWTVVKRFLKFLRDLRNKHFDLVLDLQGLFRSGFFAAATHAPVRIGPAEKRELGWIFYNHRTPPMPHDTHIVDRIASVGELLDLDLENPEFVVHIADTARTKIAEMLRENSLTPDNFIVLAPGGTWPSKRWPVDRFAELAQKIHDDLQLPVVLLGGPGEKKLADEILKISPNAGIVDFTGRTTLPELLALVDAAKALVCNDSGPMHMAVALNKPLTAIIGPTNALRTGPYRRPNSIVKTAEPCSPCYKRNCPKVKEKDSAVDIPLCMTKITVAQVFENLKSQITF